VKAKTRYGEFSVFAAGDLISRALVQYGEWAQCELEILGQFISPGDAVVDAGGYIGTHSVAFAMMVGNQGRVHSFEPNSQAHELLVANVLANAPNNVSIHKLALGETCSRAQLESAESENFGAMRLRLIRKTTKNSIAVKKLDSFHLKNVKFIKADVEGWEMPLLRGSTETIASFRPTIFLECNSLEAIVELPAWVRQTKYISYGISAAAFNPSNFNKSKENIFGLSKECGFLLIPKERMSQLSMTLQHLNLPLISTIDDAALLLLHKPQYAYEILEKSIAAKTLGIKYPSPALSDARYEYEIKVHDPDSEARDLRAKLGSLTLALERDCAERIVNHEVKAERKNQAIQMQVDSLALTIQSLQREIDLQKASFYKKAHETNQAHVALETELQEDLLRTQREILVVERDWAGKLADQQAKAERNAEVSAMRIDSLNQEKESFQREMVLLNSSVYKEAEEASKAHAVREIELQEALLTKHTTMEGLHRDWAAKLADQQALAERNAQALAIQVDSLTRANQALQQETLLERAFFFKKAHETNEAHVTLERELQEELFSAQQEVLAVQRDWASRMADQEAEAERKANAIAEQVNSLTQSLLLAKQEQLRQEVAYSEMAVGANQVQALEKQLREAAVSTQREIEALERDWATRMVDQEVKAERKTNAIAEQVNSLTQSLLLAKQEQLRQELAYSAMALAAGEAQAAVEQQLHEVAVSAQREIEALERVWVAKMADRQAEADGKLEVMTKQVGALTQSLRVAKDEQRSEEISYSERAIEVSRIHSAIEIGLQQRLSTVQMDIEALQLAKDRLEVEKACLESNIIWRASETARIFAIALFRKFVPHTATNPLALPLALQEPKKQNGLSASINDNLLHIHEGGTVSDPHDAEMHEILGSGLFDREYYLSSYADIASAAVDPLLHFINFGWKEGRNPSASFDTKFYLDTYPDVKESNANPLIHYVRYGKAEERKKTSIEMLSDVALFFDLYDREKRLPTIAGTLAIDIVIPIYNGFDFLEPLFKSIFGNTKMPYRLILVDDASPDIRIKQFLLELLRANTDIEILLIENSENLGFVGSVNKAVAEVRNHFVLLNSDTEVPPNWLERLMYPILIMDKVASTTPFTNSGTICSFPVYLKDNSLFEDLNCDVIDSYCQLVKYESNYLPIPTGIGFCMGINKRVVDEIGMFDECFGKGYCEENDWCMRAEEIGYQNLHVPNLFVYHKHGGSFPSEERKRLMERNYSILLKKHPSYDIRVQDFIRTDSMKELRQFLIMLLSSNEAGSSNIEGAILIFDNELGGGAHQFRDHQIRKMVNRGDAVFLISYKENKEKIATLGFHFRTYNFSFTIRNPDHLVKLFRSLKVREIIVNSIVSFPNVENWMALITRIGTGAHCKLSVMVHDFFAVCPSYTLINDSGEYCGVPTDMQVCSGCLIRNKGDFRRFESHVNILSWRTHWEGFLRGCDEIVCFGNSSADILRRAYPSIEMEKIVIQPHDIAGRFKQIYSRSWNGPVKNIGVLGAINLAKGSNVVRELVEYIDDRRLPVNVILFGEIDIEIKSASFEVTGRYDIEYLESIVVEKNIDVFLLPSIWPETFSFTADEIMQMGFPLVVFDVGAPAERVKDYVLGKVINPNDLYKTLFGDEESVRAA